MRNLIKYLNIFESRFFCGSLANGAAVFTYASDGRLIIACTKPNGEVTQHVLAADECVLVESSLVPLWVLKHGIHYSVLGLKEDLSMTELHVFSVGDSEDRLESAHQFNGTSALFISCHSAQGVTLAYVLTCSSPKKCDPIIGLKKLWNLEHYVYLNSTGEVFLQRHGLSVPLAKGSFLCANDDHVVTSEECARGSQLFIYDNKQGHLTRTMNSDHVILEARAFDNGSLVYTYNDGGVVRATFCVMTKGTCIDLAAFGQISLGQTKASHVNMAVKSLVDGAYVAEVDGHGETVHRTSFVPASRTLQIPKSITVSSGASILVYEPKCANGSTLVSLHGGPESVEVDDLRYGGLYRSVLKRGTRVVVLNYRGSSRFGTQRRCEVWRKWERGFHLDLQDVFAVMQEAYAFDIKTCVVLGFSFGATLALAAGCMFPRLAGIIPVSGMYDLTNHIRQSEGREHLDWFDERFSDEDKQNFSCARWAQDISVPVRAIHGSADEVCRFRDAEESKKLARQAAKDWTLATLEGQMHVPDNETEQLVKYRLVLAHIAQFLNRPSYPA